ncbi:hypothetical protein [Bacteroides ilei]|uniref:hypothetical protein n=1 Tax=Bacteroides ilei TaxID=1907658 RepID=UPI000931D1D4|nr:hypothetical protein [Bacteroides ilei]
MKKIKSFYYEIVISKIYMLEKYKQEFDERNIYNGIWVTLQTLFVFTACIILFILVHICGIPQYKLSIALGTVILCLIVVNAIIKKLKQDRYVQIIHEEYLKMNVEERKKHYKRGLWKVIPIFLYPIITIAFLKLITVIF